jgi:hypothetical protein
MALYEDLARITDPLQMASRIAKELTTLAESSGGGGPPYSTQEVAINWRSYDDGTLFFTGAATFTKVGNLVTMMIHAISNDASVDINLGGPGKITTFYDGAAPDNFPIPVGFRPAGSVSGVWTLILGAPDNAAVNAFVSISSAGDITVFKNTNFDNIGTIIGGAFSSTISWTV